MSSFVGVMFALALVDSVEKRGGNGKGRAVQVERCDECDAFS